MDSTGTPDRYATHALQATATSVSRLPTGWSQKAVWFDTAVGGVGGVASGAGAEEPGEILPHQPLELRALATPEAAKAVLDTLQKPGASKKDTGATIQRVVHDQCVDGCWTEENPDSNRRDVCPHSIPDA